MSCKCGCNGLANPGKDYINGHQRRGIPHSAGTLTRMSKGFASRAYAPKTCAVCAKEFVPDHARRSTCSRECKKNLKLRVREAWFATPEGKASGAASTVARRAVYAANPQKVRDAVLRSMYGITRAEWGVLYGKQEGLCAICLCVLELGRKTHVDHCHTTGKIRGLLCHHCNVAVGMLKNDPAIMRSAATYAEFHTAASAA